ncbi:MAG: glycoside hydrolase family 95 protein, partial [Ginsengibacter sp.]
MQLRKNIKLKFALFVALLYPAINSVAQSEQDLKLWYNKPSGDIWENALPVGNGFLGAMVYGNVHTETIQLNEYTVWSGSPNRNDNPLALDSLSEIRKLIFAGKQKEAEEIANRVIISKKSQGQMYEPVGELHLAFDAQNNYTDYYRELDIEKAIAKTSYKVGSVTYTREVLASFPDRVVVVRLTASKPGSLSFNAFYSTPQPNAKIKSTASKELTIAATTIDHEGIKGKVKFKGITRIKTEGGSVSTTDTSLVVKAANAATIYISIATNFNNYQDLNGNENERAVTYLNKAYPKKFADILKAHISAYQKYFNRVKLDLGTTNAAKLPTDERLKNFDTAEDPQFLTLYYQFGRYLLISSSQPGGQPATLQGIWNNKMYPPWDSKYT